MLRGKYSASYRARLLESAQVLAAFLAAHGQSWQLVVNGKSKVIDTALEEFIRCTHDSGKKFAWRIAKHAVLYVQASRRRLKKTLKGAWTALRTWEEQSPSSLRPPMPRALLVAFVCQARLFAEKETDASKKCLWHVFGVLLHTGFFAFLRPGELL